MQFRPNFSRAHLFFQLVRRKFAQERVLPTASALTYTTLLSLVPMVTVVLLVMRQFSPFMKLGEGMRAFLLQNLLPERAGKVVATYALQFSDKASSLTVVGTVMLVITAVMLLATIDRTFSGIWEVTRPRAWFVRIPVYWVVLTLGPVIFAASVAAGSSARAMGAPTSGTSVASDIAAMVMKNSAASASGWRQNARTPSCTHFTPV